MSDRKRGSFGKPSANKDNTRPRSAFGTKRTYLKAKATSASDPKRTLAVWGAAEGKVDSRA